MDIKKVDNATCIELLRTMSRSRATLTKERVATVNRIKALFRGHLGENINLYVGTEDTPEVRKARVAKIKAEAAVLFHLYGESAVPKDEAAALKKHSGRTAASLKRDLKTIREEWGDVLDTWYEGLDVIDSALGRQKRRIEKVAKRLPAPVCAKAVEIPGFSIFGLGQLVGECGDLSQYSNPAKLWKRMGLGLVKTNGTWIRQQRVAGEAALIHGYSPIRRAIAWNWGRTLHQYSAKAPKKSPWRRIVEERTPLEIAKLSQDPELTEKHVSAWTRSRVMRYLSKRAVREVWREWRKVSGFSYAEPVQLPSNPSHS